MDSLRGVAIIFVVFTHISVVAWGDAKHFGGVGPFHFLLNIVHGPTILFVFISGFMFHHVFYRGFDYWKFLHGKLKTVLAPYVLFTAILTLMFAVEGGAPSYVVHRASGELSDPYSTFALALITGDAGYALWYVPFITIVFLLSPVFLRFIEAPERTRLVMLAVAFVVGLFVHRAPLNADKLQMLLYLTFFYVGGIYCSIHHARFIAFCQRPATLTLGFVLVFGLAFGQFLLGGLSSPVGPYFDWQGIDLHYLQKVALAVALSSLFIQAAWLNSAWLATIARDSFGIFFVHNVLVHALELTGWPRTGHVWVDFMTAGTSVLLGSHLIVLMIRAVAGKRSRVLVGA